MSDCSVVLAVSDLVFNAEMRAAGGFNMACQRIESYMHDAMIVRMPAVMFRDQLAWYLTVPLVLPSSPLPNQLSFLPSLII